MIGRKNIHQQSNQIVSIDQWPVFGDYEVFPVGARDKSLRVCPDNSNYDFCLPNHKYLFKETIKSAKDPRLPRYPDQYWSEIIAFKIGRLMRLDVPPVFVALNEETGEPGSLIEWFTGYDSQVEERYTYGGDHMQSLIEGYDREKGRQHNMMTIISFLRGLKVEGLLGDSWKEYWGLCLCFDALIGNTDRHQENWGVLWDDRKNLVRLTPFFDNGTSLGHELFPEKFKKCIRDENMLKAYVRRGKHHMKWNITDKHRMPLIDGVSQYCQKYPAVVPILLDKLNWKEEELNGILSELTTFNIKSPLTTARAEFIYKLTCFRRRLLLENLESISNEIY